MVPRLPTTVDLAPLLLVGWQVVFPVTELRYLSSLVLLIAAVARRSGSWRARFGRRRRVF